jgi:hypothetical protein
MKNINTLLCSVMLLCAAACSSGAAYIPVPDIDTTQMPLTPGSTTGNANDGNAINTDLSQTPAQAPQFQPTIDGDVFIPKAVFYASGQDPQNHPMLMLVVSDQNDLCTQLTTSHQVMPGSSQLVMYLYSVQASAGSGILVAPPSTAGTYAVFDSAAPNADISANPSQGIPTDAGGYASGMFATFDPQCSKTHRHLLSEGDIGISVVDAANAKTSGAIQVLLDDSVSLSTGGSFVAQACPALLQIPSAPTSCKLP